MELDLAGTYDAAAGVQRLKRCFLLTETGLRLMDEGQLESAQEVIWVFLLRQKPVWENGRILAGNLEIQCPAGLAFEAEEIPVTDGRMARNWPGSLWRVQLRSERKEEFRAEFVFTDAD
ncbi:MAG: hypothetical protein IKE08_05810 [Clostridia bacterium]|nr:hypothetical protein [Clostridia bacterium]